MYSLFLPSLFQFDGLFRSANLTAASAVSGLFSAAWEGSLLAICVLLSLRFFPGLSAAARSAVWSIVFLALILLHGWPALGSHAAATGPAHPATFQLSIAWSIGIAAVWAVLSLLRAGQLALSAVRLRALARRATPVAADAAIEPLLQIKIAGKIARRALLCTSDEVERPSVFGFFHPRILLPPALMKQLSASELQQVILHEMEHLRRADDWTNLAQKLALVLFPLNPALLWVEHRLCAERELACDDSVLRSSCGRKAYAICLTHLAEYTMLRRSLSLALGAWERQSELVRRVHRILRRPAEPMNARRTMALTGGLAAAVLAGAAALAHSPQLVGFAVTTPESEQAQLEPLPAPAFHAVNASAASEFGHAQLVNAIMPDRIQGRAEMTSQKPRIAHRNPTLRASRQPAPPPQMLTEQQTLIVMTAWNTDSMRPQVVFTVAHTSRNPALATTGEVVESSLAAQTAFQARQAAAQKSAQDAQEVPVRATYAAVPFANGWLFVRI